MKNMKKKCLCRDTHPISTKNHGNITGWRY